MKHYCKSFELVSCLLYLFLFVDSRTRQKKKPRGWWHLKERFSHPVFLEDNKWVNTGNKGTIKQAIDWFKARDIASYNMRDEIFPSFAPNSHSARVYLRSMEYFATRGFEHGNLGRNFGNKVQGRVEMVGCSESPQSHQLQSRRRYLRRNGLKEEVQVSLYIVMILMMTCN